MEIVRLVLRTTILIFLDVFVFINVFAFVDLMEVMRLVLRTAIFVFLDSAFPFLLDELLHHLLGIGVVTFGQHLAKFILGHYSHLLLAELTGLLDLICRDALHDGLSVFDNSELTILMLYDHNAVRAGRDLLYIFFELFLESLEYSKDI